MLDLVIIDTSLAVYGISNLPLHINNIIFASVHKFIVDLNNVFCLMCISVYI